ncbi:MAG: hypothetical protein RIQ81_1799 [Pseudomonadota bacterium]|jgi:hypothetical protein
MTIGGKTMKSKYLVSATLAFAAISALLTSCGPGDPLERPKDHKYEFVVENQSNQPVKISADAYYGGYCDRGYVTAIIPPKSKEKVKITFAGCVNGGGERVDSLSLTMDPEKRDYVQYPVSGSKIVCTDENGCIVNQSN